MKPGFGKQAFNSEYVVPIVFLALSLLAWQWSGLSGSFVFNQVINRFIRDGILVLSLVIPVVAGMGLNFAITVGAMSMQTAVLIMIAYRVSGVTDIAGYRSRCRSGGYIGLCDRGYSKPVQGKEMITTIIIGFRSTASISSYSWWVWQRYSGLK